jgi:FixJ family two-component response regulator
MSAPARVFIIDDDDAVRSGLRLLLESAGFEVEDHSTADAFLARCSPGARGCVISDIQMPGLDGLQLQAHLERCGFGLPVIMLSGHADVPVAVQSLKAGAIDFLQKPFDPEQLLAQVRVAIALDAQWHAASARAAHRDALHARLTPRERDVLARIAHGHSNKAVAADLRISERTVELHRAHGMKKLELRNVAELVLFLNAGDRGARDSGGD